MAREKRVKDKLRMIEETDEKKVSDSLQTSNAEQNDDGQFRVTISALQPFQNYTSTDENRYSETIEKRKVREAIGTLKQNMKHDPVSSVERKK